MRLGELAARDGDEAREPRLRGQQVVVGDVQAARPLGVGQAIADREDPALRVVEEAEAHPVREGRRRAGRGPRRPASRSPSASAMSAPARFPLSTVET